MFGPPLPRCAVSLLCSLESEGQRAKAWNQKVVLPAGVISRKTSMGSNYCGAASQRHTPIIDCIHTSTTHDTRTQ